MVGLLFSRGRKSTFSTVKDENSQRDRTGWVGVVWVWAGLGFGHSCCCGVWWEWAQLNAWSIPSWSLVGWADGWMSCPSATVHHPEGGRGYSGWCSSCQSSSALPLPPYCTVPARPQSWTSVPNLLSSPALMPPPQHTILPRTVHWPPLTFHNVLHTHWMISVSSLEFSGMVWPGQVLGDLDHMVHVWAYNLYFFYLDDIRGFLLLWAWTTGPQGVIENSIMVNSGQSSWFFKMWIQYDL